MLESLIRVLAPQPIGQKTMEPCLTHVARVTPYPPNQIKRRDAAQLKERAGVVPPLRPRDADLAWSAYHSNQRISTGVDDHNLLGKLGRPELSAVIEAAERRSRREAGQPLEPVPARSLRLGSCDRDAHPFVHAAPPDARDVVRAALPDAHAAAPHLRSAPVPARHRFLLEAASERPLAAVPGEGELAAGWGRMRRRAPRRPRSSAV